MYPLGRTSAVEQLEVALAQRGQPIGHPVDPAAVQMAAPARSRERPQAGDGLQQRRDGEPDPAQVDRREVQMDHPPPSLPD